MVLSVPYRLDWGLTGGELSLMLASLICHGLSWDSWEDSDGWDRSPRGLSSEGPAQAYPRGGDHRIPSSRTGLAHTHKAFQVSACVCRCPYAQLLGAGNQEQQQQKRGPEFRGAGIYGNLPTTPHLKLHPSLALSPSQLLWLCNAPTFSLTPCTHHTRCSSTGNTSPLASPGHLFYIQNSDQGSPPLGSLP